MPPPRSGDWNSVNRFLTAGGTVEGIPRENKYRTYYLQLMKKRMNQTKEPETIEWHGMKLVRISDVNSAVYDTDLSDFPPHDRFSQWLEGQTLPLVEGNEHPYDWAYYHDYERFIRNKPVVD